MRYLRYAFLGVLGILLISISLANRAAVDLTLFPEPVAEVLGFNFTLSAPLFLVILGSIAAGIVVGFVWEWFREHKHRREASQSGREVRRLRREVGRMKEEKHKDKDEVLALLDEAS